MYLIVGLGNPGKKYKNTRHNVGFIALDEITKNPKFQMTNDQSNLNVKISKGTINDQKVVLAKPQTFMNESGRAVKKIIEHWKLKIENLIIIHDDIDIPLGKIKVSVGRGSAGHKGVESIIKTLGTKDFTRIRIGICPLSGKPKDVENFVLKNFTAKELPLLKQGINQAATQITQSIAIAKD